MIEVTVAKWSQTVENENRSSDTDENQDEDKRSDAVCRLDAS
jgi:hypothetical protein